MISKSRKSKVQYRGEIDPKFAMLRQRIEAVLGRRVATYSEAIRRGLVVMAEECGVKI